MTNRFLMGRQDLGARLRDYFGSSSQIVTVAPDSLKLIYTTSPGRKVAVHVNADVRPAPWQYRKRSAYYQYRFGDFIFCHRYATFAYIGRDDANHTLKNLPILLPYWFKIKPIDGVRIIPDNVTVTIPVEASYRVAARWHRL